jgi:hypothetical protein
MIRKSVSVVLLVLLLSSPFNAFAQSPPAQSENKFGDPWARLRFVVGEEKVVVTTKPGLTLRGMLVRFEWEAVTLRDDKGADHVLPRVEVAEVRTLPDRRRLLRPVAGGAVGGATVGMIGGAISAMEQTKAEGKRRFVLGLSVGAAAGALIGLIAGRAQVQPARTLYRADDAAKKAAGTTHEPK